MRNTALQTQTVFKLRIFALGFDIRISGSSLEKILSYFHISSNCREQLTTHMDWKILPWTSQVFVFEFSICKAESWKGSAERAVRSVVSHYQIWKCFKGARFFYSLILWFCWTVAGSKNDSVSIDHILMLPHCPCLLSHCLV